MGISPTSNNNQEMQERGTMRLIPNGVSQNHSLAQSSSTIDNMDLDQVVEDDNIAVESRAVRRVDFLWAEENWREEEGEGERKGMCS